MTTKKKAAAKKPQSEDFNEAAFRIVQQVTSGTTKRPKAVRRPKR